MARRKRNLAIPGQIEFDFGNPKPVTISELSEEKCRLQEELPELASNEFLKLWLGAVGPLRVRVSTQSRTDLEFDGAIHPAIVEHFNV